MRRWKDKSDTDADAYEDMDNNNDIEDVVVS